jgi:Helix-turn-helix domain
MHSKQVRLLKPTGHACRILHHLVSGRTLTVMQAFRLFECCSLSSRLNELRKRGWMVKSREVRLKSGKRVQQYSL